RRFTKEAQHASDGRTRSGLAGNGLSRTGPVLRQAVQPDHIGDAEASPGLGLKISKIAFGPASGTCADQIVEALISDFVSQQVEVVDRQHLGAILAEHNLTTRLCRSAILRRPQNSTYWTSPSERLCWTFIGCSFHGRNRG